MSTYILLAVIVLVYIIASTLVVKFLSNAFKKMIDEAPVVPDVGEIATTEIEPIDLSPIITALEDLDNKVYAQSADFAKSLREVKKTLKETPSKTLSTIQGSVNNTVGKMGEMMQLIELQRQFDRLIVVGDIVDFIGIVFPTEDHPGSINFIDVKTGKSAALSTDQRKLRNMIDELDHDLLNFQVVKVQIT